MKRIFLFFVTSLFAVAAFAQPQGKEKISLNVLYVGGSSDWMDGGMGISTNNHPDSIASRTGAFEALLKDNFTGVTVVQGSEYKPEMSAKYDVTILDSKIPKLRNRIHKGNEYYGDAYLPNDFSYPTMFLVETGDVLGRTLGTKTDWFCLCMAGDAYNVNTEHPIFNTPYKVNITLEEKPTPENAFEYQGYFSEPISKTQKMWKVQTLDYQNSPQFRIGMISRPWGYTDSPEAEAITGGVSAKSPDAVGIGRHGNFFHWGFSASPKYMTDEAKTVFVNAVVYTSKLKGERLIARKYDLGANKADIPFKCSLVTDEAYDEYVQMTKESNEQMNAFVQDIKEKQAKGETLTETEKMYLSMPLREEVPSKEQYLKRQLGKYYDTYKDNIKGYQKYMKENLPYFIANDNYGFDLDEDAKSLKIANTDKAILNKAITLWEKGKDVEKAKRILDRYTNCFFETPQQWREWYNSVEEKLFFTQSGGWKWLVDTKDTDEPANDYDAKPIYKAAKSIELPATNENEPVVVGATVCSLPGGRQCVVVKVKIHDGYHIYSPLINPGAFTPTKVEVILPEGYIADPMKYPATVMSVSGTPEFQGEIIFSQPVYGVGGEKLEVMVQYQCCDPSICFPPVEKKLELKPIF